MTTTGCHTGESRYPGVKGRGFRRHCERSVVISIFALIILGIREGLIACSPFRKEPVRTVILSDAKDLVSLFRKEGIEGGFCSLSLYGAQ